MTMTTPTTETGIVEPKAWVDANGVLRAPEGYAFESVDLPGFDASGYPRKGLRLVPLIGFTTPRAAIAAMPDSTQLLQTMAECDALKHDVERQMTIANIECNEAERLRQILQTMAGALDIAAGRLEWLAKNIDDPRSDVTFRWAEEAKAPLAQFRAQEQRS